MDLERCQYFFTTNYLDRVDAGIINRCFVIEMSQSTNPADYVKMGQSILQKMTLAPTAIPVASIKAIAQKAKGSLRDFVNDVVFAALQLGGILPK